MVFLLQVVKQEIVFYRGFRIELLVQEKKTVTLVKTLALDYWWTALSTRKNIVHNGLSWPFHRPCTSLTVNNALIVTHKTITRKRT